MQPSGEVSFPFINYVYQFIIKRLNLCLDNWATIFEGRIEFDSEVIKSKMANTIKDYEISFSLSKPKTLKKEQKKYNKVEKQDATQSYKKHKYKKKNK